MGEVLVSGVTVIRDGVRLGYPFLEAVRSALPICEEYVVVAGRGSDGTLDALHALAAEEPKVRVVESEWSSRVTPAKAVLAQQTNIGLHLARGAWALVLQGNEVLHERDLPRLRAMLEEYADDAETEALLLERLTFFVDYEHVVATYPERFKWTARAVKPHVGMHAVRDAMNFAVFDGWSTRGRNPRARDTGVDLYRYGLVHDAESYARKLADAAHLAAVGQRAEEQVLQHRYPRAHVARFEGTHPTVMVERIAAHAIDFDPATARVEETRAERRRRRETAWYLKRGFPKWRHTRYKLLGDYAEKPRESS